MILIFGRGGGNQWRHACHVKYVLDVWLSSCIHTVLSIRITDNRNELHIETKGVFVEVQAAVVWEVLRKVGERRQEATS